MVASVHDVHRAGMIERPPVRLCGLTRGRVRVWPGPVSGHPLNGDGLPTVEDYILNGYVKIRIRHEDHVKESAERRRIEGLWVARLVDDDIRTEQRNDLVN